MSGFRRQMDRRTGIVQLDIDQSLSCESYTDNVVKFNQQMRPPQGEINDIKHTGEDKENIPQTNKCDESIRLSAGVSELSVSSPKQRHSLSSQSAATSLTSPNLPTKQHQSVTTDSSKHEPGSRGTSMNYSSIPSRPKNISSQSALLNATEEQPDNEEEGFSILYDLMASEVLLQVDRSKPVIQRSMNKQLPTNQTTVSSVRSLAASSYTENNSSASARRRRLARGSHNDIQSRMIIESVRQRAANNNGHRSYNPPAEVEPEAVDAVKPQSKDFSDASSRTNSDPEIVVTPSGEENDHFKAADWRAKSDQEIVFMPSGEGEGNDQESDTSTALVLDPSSIQHSSSPITDDSEGDSTVEVSARIGVSEQKRPLNDKKKKRIVFSGRKFFAKKSGKKDSPDSAQRKSEKCSNGKGTETPNQSASENSKPSETSAYPNVDQTNHHTRPNASAYNAAAAAAGLKFFAKKSGKKDPPDSAQRKSEKCSNGKGTETPNQSASENSKPSETSAYPNVDQTNHHTRPNASAYNAAATGFVPNYYPPTQNVYYVSDPGLAQAYRDYAQYLMRAQATQCSYNPPTNAHYFNAHTANYCMPSIQSNAPNVIRLGTNGTSGVNHCMTSHGIQISLPSTNSTNVTYINL